jgi:hypothetical protein
MLPRDTTYCRQELDQFGAQVGLMLEHKISDEITIPQPADGFGLIGQENGYFPATYSLEMVPWLRTWQYGQLRAQRETSWFLGLNFGQENYVIAYCMLTGQEAIRERIGALLWHHMHVVRALAVASGRRQFEASDLYEEFAALLATTPKAAQLDSITFAFTIFNRDTRTAVSGHFGSARPFVVGVENVVSPSNKVVLTYAQGRDLRYWHVAAALNEPHTYILSYDTSKLDANPGDNLQKRVALSLAQAESVDELHRVLSSLVVEGNLPRYYLAAVMLPKEEAAAPAPELLPLDKAE